MKFSYSRVSCFNTCPYQFKLRYIDKLQTYPSFDPQNALYLGTALHTGIEKDYAAARENYLANFPIIDDLQINELIKLEELIPKVKSILPAGECELEVNDDEFVGFLDRLVKTSEGHYDLYDYKHSNNVDRYLESSQLHVYKHFYEKTHPGHVIDNLYFVFVPKTMIRQKKSEDLHQFRQRLLTTLGSMEVRIERVEFNFLKVMEYLASVESIKFAREYPKCPSRLCDWCEFQSYCEKGETTNIITRKD
jgi:RecB family exonuclease